MGESAADIPLSQAHEVVADWSVECERKTGIDGRTGALCIGRESTRRRANLRHVFL